MISRRDSSSALEKDLPLALDDMACFFCVRFAQIHKFWSTRGYVDQNLCKFYTNFPAFTQISLIFPQNLCICVFVFVYLCFWVRSSQ